MPFTLQHSSNNGLSKHGRCLGKNMTSIVNRFLFLRLAHIYIHTKYSHLRCIILISKCVNKALQENIFKNRSLGSQLPNVVWCSIKEWVLFNICCYMFFCGTIMCYIWVPPLCIMWCFNFVLDNLSTILTLPSINLVKKLTLAFLHQSG